MDTYRLADLINAAGDGTADSLVADLREDLTARNLDPEAVEVAAESLRELLNTVWA